VEGLLQDDQRDDGEGHADVEAPAPAQPGRVDDDTPDQRAADGGEREHGSDVAGVAAAFARRDHHRHDHLCQGGEAAGADALHDAGRDEHGGILREAGERRTGDEDDQPQLDQDLLARQVRELAPDRRGDRGRQERRGDHPGIGGLTRLQVGDDRG
jgi:hypothetical protein